MSRSAKAVSLLVVVLLAVPLHALTLARTISRESPDLPVRNVKLSLGRDGLVYLSADSYVLRMKPDGGDRLGAKLTYSTTNAVANRAGVVATANAHFNHAVKLWGSAFEPLGAVVDFLVSDAAGWSGPCDVQAGETDFYGLDSNRDRVVRVAPPGRMVTTYSLAACGESLVSKIGRLRVWEAGRRFYLATMAGKLHVLDFDGRLLWSKQLVMEGSPWDGYRAVFDVDADGTLWVLGEGGATLQRYGLDGNPAGSLALAVHSTPGRWASLAVGPDSILARQHQDRELFSVWSRAGGSLQHTVAADIEQLDVTLPGLVWTAGANVPLDVKLTSATRANKPPWRVWLRPLLTADWRELPLSGGQVTVPADLAGLYQLRICPGLGADRSEYRLEEVVEVRPPGAHGSATVMTPGGRVAFGRGEAIRCRLLLRGQNLPATAPVRLLNAAGQVVIERSVAANGEFVIEPAWTRALAPDRYRLVAVVEGLTCMAQPLTIGPGRETDPALNLVQYGDYGATYPQTEPLDAPDAVARHLERTRRLGINRFVDRLGMTGAGSLNRVTESGALPQVAERLKGDPLAVAPERVGLDNALAQTMAGYSALGADELAILLYMDAGLPIGTAFDKRTREQFAADITTVTQALTPYSAFRGWNWVANWWIGDRGPDAADKPAYDAALKAAKDSGAWSPVLDKVSGRWLGYATEAQRYFAGVVDKLAPGLLHNCAGPYRSVDVYPPVTFAGVDEVDLHYQSEQIQPPQVTPHNVDFQKRPGKRAYGHPELWNDDGTGGQILPSLLQMVMRGADGVGCSGAIPEWFHGSGDPRSGSAGVPSVFRAVADTLTPWGPWLATLSNRDRVAIVVSGRMVRTDEWSNLGGLYFNRLFEAYQACLYAHRPASFVFADDLKAGTLDRYQAVLVVSQRVEPEPALAAALAGAAAKVLTDDTCRAGLVRGTALGMGFDHLEKDPSPWQDDSAWLRLPPLYERLGQALAKGLAKVAPVADVTAPGVMLSERGNGAGRFVWVVNNRAVEREAGELWRATLAITQRVPQRVPLGLPQAGASAVYELFSGRRETASPTADLTTSPARLYAILPEPIARVGLRGPRSVSAGAPLAWGAWVHDEQGRALATSLPVTVQLRAGDGRLLDERHAAAVATDGATGRFIVPLNPPAGALTLTATELVSGRTASLPIALTPAKAPSDQVAAMDSRGVGTASAKRVWPAQRFGPRVRSAVLLPGGNTVALGTLGGEANLLGVDLADGRLRWSQRVGDYAAVNPRPCGRGWAVQGFDYASAYGWHLYLADDNGQAERRFALYGLPKRGTAWHCARQLGPPINQFATAPDGSWVACGGDLGLVAYSRDGTPRWSHDTWKTGRAVPRLTALDDTTLLAADGAVVTALDAANGAERWRLELANTGQIISLEVSADRRTVAVSADTLGGRVWLVRGGKLAGEVPLPADEVALSPDGQRLATVREDQLRLYDGSGGLLWTARGVDWLRCPSFSPDGRRLVATSELGDVLVWSADGQPLLNRDLGCWATPVWLPDGDLLLATWLGTVVRLDGQYHERWRTWLAASGAAPSPAAALPPAAALSTVAKTDWGNALAGAPLPLTPNLLTETKALIEARCDPPAHADPRIWQNPVDLLRDGQPTPPVQPWLAWTDLNYVDSGWRDKLTLVFDTFHTQLHVDALTFVEDPARPNTWLRDARLQWWNAAQARWLDGPYLLSNQAVHSHRVDPPLEAARFRLISTGGGSWPTGNLALGEIVFHGRQLGASHPDVQAKRPVAVLFDEDETDLKGYDAFQPNSKFRYEDAASGGKCLSLTGAGAAHPVYIPPFGHVLPNWDFEIVENPQPGQYRWLQFAWKALSRDTTGLSLLVGGPWPSGGYGFRAGTPTFREGTLVYTKVADSPPLEWRRERFDLWKLYGKPVRIQSASFTAEGGPAAFDSIVLAREETDLPPK
ncbi:MAG: PQQ-binding-like beta-propeller repeat protein [Armatimonadetes bacterium]|nr:PQQ-binding-like beta-propeller repeat protein [Armatimonadota bacterium]